MTKKTFLVLLPVPAAALMLAGLAVAIFRPEVANMGNFLINAGLFFPALRLSIIIQEAGHLAAARLVGGTPREIILGKGSEVYRTRLLGIHITLRAQFSDGFSVSTFGNLSFLKVRYLLVILGGSLATILVMATITWLAGFDFYNTHYEFSVSPGAVFILASIVTLLRNLIPHTTTTLGTQHPNDGRLLLQWPFMSTGDVRRQLDAALVHEGMAHLENHDYTRARKVFREYLDKHPDNAVLALNLAFISLRTGDFEASLQTALPLHYLLEQGSISKSVAPHLYSHLAWTYLVLNDVEAADRFSLLALNANPNNETVGGTRGAVLVEKGEVAAGMKLLFPVMDFDQATNETLAAAIYLVLAYHHLGEMKSCIAHLNFVYQNLDALEADQKVIFERVLAKTGIQYKPQPV